jgi:2-oxoglutarate ferredoxin oxidoreductase subunit beta
MADTDAPAAKLKAADFAAPDEVRWCPGCGDYAIIKAVKRVMADVGARPDNTLVISGIGCSSRFPYYMATYGLHGIHGRAPAIASGVMLAKPDLDVWIITGDGDGLAIGGNHLVHLLRRNFNCQILLFNNEIYGLTKGQYSPTSHQGTRSPSSPMGTIDVPVDPARLALGSGGTFVARAVDAQQEQLYDILTAAYHHPGAAFVEIFQNCIVFNDEVHAPFSDKKTAPEHQLQVRDGEPLVYGAAGDKGITPAASGFGLVTGTLPAGTTPLRHDAANRALAFALAEMAPPAGPMATGILYQRQEPTYQQLALGQIAAAQARPKRRSIDELLHDGITWTVE